MNYVQVSNLDFNDIKTALKEYLRAQTDFTDFDFEGSAWANLLDVLAYNTYYTAFNTNMVVNELFLDSATLRDNVVTLAKQLGYKPKSVVAPEAVLNFKVSFPGTAPSNIILRKGTGFVTTFDDKLYRFVAVDDIKVPVANNEAFFTNVSLFEGTLITNRFVVSKANSTQKFLLSNANADTSTIRVKIFDSPTSDAFVYYNQIDTIIDIGSQDNIFYVQETLDEQYELFFGDNVIGRALDDQEVIEVSYLTTNGTSTNGASQFTFAGTLVDDSDQVYPVSISNVETVSNASGGAAIESIDKIRFNAPKQYATQNRAVTAADYAAIVRKIYPAVSDIIVYGGEEERYPEYGKVKIIIKPNSGSVLSTFTKQQIVDGLRDYAVASVTPEILDASVVYIEIDSKVYYNTRRTTQFPDEIRSKVISAVDDYTKLSGTEKFNGKFRYSKYVGVIDETDPSINSNTTTITLRKDFYPSLNSTFYYELCFQNEFGDSCDGPVVQSTGFKVTEYPNYTVYFEDRDGKIVLYRLDPATGQKIVLNDDLGTVDYVEGEIKLYDVTIISGSFFDNRIQVRVQPAKNDINAERSLYLDVDITNSKFTVYPE
ncbi:baseplate wedge subunit [Synechococcus phage S-CAM3]|uniref:Baseplate wedge subunit n=1 Tax=Synechococcus phage S-CAM3 TaxID=1883366 RepID=A0A1D8KJL6_9CAUD|nr:baseplate wedge subunit [Synechococcus phage S-CAM3]